MTIMVPAVDRERVLSAFKADLYEKGINPRTITERAKLFEGGFFEAAAIAERNGRSLANEVLDVQKEYQLIALENLQLRLGVDSVQRFCEGLMTIYEEDSPAEARLEKMVSMLGEWMVKQ